MSNSIPRFLFVDTNILAIDLNEGHPYDAKKQSNHPNGHFGLGTCSGASLIVSRKTRQHDVFREPCYVDYPASPVIPQKEQGAQCL